MVVIMDIQEKQLETLEKIYKRIDDGVKAVGIIGILILLVLIFK